MTTQRITDDLVRLLDLLPEAVQQHLATDQSRDGLLEVVLDLGRIASVSARFAAPRRASMKPDAARITSSSSSTRGKQTPTWFELRRRASRADDDSRVT